VLGVPGDGAGEYLGLDVTAGLDEPVRAERVVYPRQALLDDRALIEIGRHVVRGRADELDALGVRLVIRLGALEGRQERVVNVDHPAFDPLADLGREDLHVPGEHDELGLGLIDH